MVTPRITPAREDELSAETVERIKASGVPGAPASNVFWTLGRHERLLKGYCAFALRLFNGQVPTRDRELVVLRTAIVCRSDYEWAQHRIVAEHLDVLTVEEIAKTVDPDWQGWTDHERALLRAVDELNKDAQLEDATWDALAVSYDEAQLVEVLMLIGFYHMLAFTANTVRIELEDDDMERVPTRKSEG